MDDSSIICGYRFRNCELLQEALTVPAFRMDHPSATDNQRLEFLGDAVLDFVTADMLFAAHPDEDEGALTVRRSRMVSTLSLSEAASRSGIVPRLRRNRMAAAIPRHSKTLADAVEAIIGAAWLDGGREAVETVIEGLGLNDEQPVANGGIENPKGELQIRAQALKPPRLPIYKLMRMTGRSHMPRFTVRVVVPDVGEAQAEAGSHKDAEAAAAAKLLAAKFPPKGSQ